MTDEVTDEIAEKAWCAFRDSDKPAPYNQVKDAIAAVAPLIEAKDRAEIERLQKEEAAWRAAAIEQQRLHKLAAAELAKTRAIFEGWQKDSLETLPDVIAQARAAAIDEAAEIVEVNVPVFTNQGDGTPYLTRRRDGDVNGLPYAKAIRALASRPVSEREEQ